MAGSPKKPAELRQGHTTRDVALRAESPPIPIAPRRLLKRTRQRWVDFWTSQVARAADPVIDLHLVERYFRAVDEYERVLPVFEKTRLVKGSTGQIALNPLASYLAQREQVMKVCETELGLTPMARARLGITIGEQKLTALELNRQLNAGGPSERGSQGEIVDGQSRDLTDDDDDDDENKWEQA